MQYKISQAYTPYTVINIYIELCEDLLRDCGSYNFPDCLSYTSMDVALSGFSLHSSQMSGICPPLIPRWEPCCSLPVDQPVMINEVDI